MTEKRRFIAGAICPKCKLEDKIFVRKQEDGTEVAECCRCGFTKAEKSEISSQEMVHARIKEKTVKFYKKGEH